MEVQYLTNENGKKTAVQISLSKWRQIKKDLHKLDVLHSLQQAFHEMKECEAGRLQPLTTDEIMSQL